MSDHPYIVVNAYSDPVDATVTPHRAEKGYLTVTAPGYEERTISDRHPKGKPVRLLFDLETARGPGLEEACEMNLEEAAMNAKVRGMSLAAYLVGDAIKRTQDRCYFKANEGTKLAARLNRSGAWKPVPSKLHKPHASFFEIVGSWKTVRRPPPILQCTLWRKLYLKGDSGVWNYVAELDQDLSGGIKHAGAVLWHHIKGEKTHPYAVNQAQSWAHGVISFRLEAGR